MEDIQSIIHGTFGYLGALVSGVIVTIITTKWINKEVVLTKRFFVQRTATSSYSDYWGKIDVLYNDMPCYNLHFITVEIRNESRKSIEDLEIVFTVPENNFIYGNSGEYKQDGLYTPLKLTDSYLTYFSEVVKRNEDRDNLEGQAKKNLERDVDIVVREKRYRMPVLNKKGMGSFTFLVNNSTHLEPALMVSIIKKDVRLALYQEEEERKESQTKWVSVITLIVLLIFSYLVYKNSATVADATMLMVVNTFVSYYTALLLYKILYWIKAYLN